MVGTQIVKLESSACVAGGVCIESQWYRLRARPTYSRALADDT
ncbi:MAG: hypothetical protein ACTHJ7_00905 [Candidatus Nitrosocosmicus sp.]